MSTTSIEGALSCLEHRAFELRAQRDPGRLEDYWTTPAGITRRVESLVQVFNYRIVNNAFKVLAPTNRAQWMKWRDFGDSNVCLKCLENARGGRNGYYDVTWFTPQMPVHDGCRCQWEIFFEHPVEQEKLPWG